MRTYSDSLGNPTRPFIPKNDTGHAECRFDANYIRNIGAQFIGTLGSTNVFSNTLPFRQRARRGEGR